VEEKLCFPFAGCAMAHQKSVSGEAAGGSVNAVYAAMHATKSCKTKRENEKTDNRQGHPNPHPDFH